MKRIVDYLWDFLFGKSPSPCAETCEARRELETRRKCSVTLTPGNERQDLLTALGQLSEDAKAIETEQSLIDALLFDRAAAALRSDPYEECFTQEFRETHFLDARLKAMTVPPVTQPHTNGGRIRAMSDNDLAAFLQNPPPLAAGQTWFDWLGDEAT